MYNQKANVYYELLKELVPQKLHRYIIFSQKPKLFIWLIVNILLMWFNNGVMFKSLIYTLIIYFVIINVALSDTVEIIIRLFEDVRHIATSVEKERLLPIFSEVYRSVENENPNISKNIKLYIADDSSINAMSIGKNTIIISRGLMETMTDEELKGIIAHEFSHISNGDTQMSILITVGTTIYLWAILILKGILNFIGNLGSQNGLLHSITSFLNSVINIPVLIILTFWTAIVASGDKKKEYLADNLAYIYGYGDNLLSALYKLYDIQITDKKKLMNRIQSGHPRIAYRIEKLESVIKY